MSRPPSAESVFRAIAHRTRRAILERLRKGERAAGEFLTSGLTKPTLSAHLSILRAAGLVQFRRTGTSLRYRLNRSALNLFVNWARQFQ
jgi:ArsR family transcriptional regulator, repressor of sdpIR and other operons